VRVRKWGLGGFYKGESGAGVVWWEILVNSHGEGVLIGFEGPNVGFCGE